MNVSVPIPAGPGQGAHLPPRVEHPGTLTPGGLEGNRCVLGGDGGQEEEACRTAQGVAKEAGNDLGGTRPLLRLTKEVNGLGIQDSKCLVFALQQLEQPSSNSGDPGHPLLPAWPQSNREPCGTWESEADLLTCLPPGVRARPRGTR